MILSNKKIFSTPRQPPWIPRGLIYSVKVGDVRPHAGPTKNHGHKPVQLHPLPPPWVYNKRHSEFSPHSFLRAPPENWSPGQHLCPGRKSLLYDVSFLFYSIVLSVICWDHEGLTKSPSSTSTYVH